MKLNPDKHYIDINFLSQIYSELLFKYIYNSTHNILHMANQYNELYLIT